MTATEQKKEFDKIVKDTQSSLRKARAAYNTSVANARKQYTKAVVGAESNFAGEIAKANAARDSGLEKAALDNTKRVAEIQRSFANQLANIIQQSQDRLRDVYRTAVTTNIADLFGTEQVNKSVDALVGELRKKLEASRTLLENASKLAASGFSQTFIEQVVAAGTTSGNELAQSILEATPETQAELKSLYGALETQSERGMDELAKTIYEGAGLATSELRKLYDQTVVDQTTALAEQAALYAEAQAQILTEFDSAITEANAKRDEALAAAHASLTEALTAATKEYRDSLDEIEKDFKDRIDALGKLQAELLKRQGIVAGQIGGAQANIPTVAGQIDAVQKATIVTIPPTSAITGGNTVNVNVKVDPGTSAAQAGKKIANVVQKYTTAGGGGSAMPWQVL
jgi:DNA-directed RNA polymerase subunit F